MTSCTGHMTSPRGNVAEASAGCPQGEARWLVLRWMSKTPAGWRNRSSRAAECGAELRCGAVVPTSRTSFRGTVLRPTSTAPPPSQWYMWHAFTHTRTMTHTVTHTPSHTCSGGLAPFLNAAVVMKLLQMWRRVLWSCCRSAGRSAACLPLPPSVFHFHSTLVSSFSPPALFSNSCLLEHGEPLPHPVPLPQSRPPELHLSSRAESSLQLSV